MPQLGAISLLPDSDLRTICEEIESADLVEAEWAERESCDMFQVGSYVGGFDADEGEFCFETVIAGVEYWFQFTLHQAKQIVAGQEFELVARPADSTPPAEA